MDRASQGRVDIRECGEQEVLRGKNVILTGATRGIGNAVLQLFVQNHANLWCLVRRPNEQFLSQTRALEERHGVWIRTVTADMEDTESIREALHTVFAEKHPIDILINNASVNAHGSFLMTSRSELDRVFQVNCFSQLQIIQMVARKMILQKSGTIINITSASGFEHNVGNFSYAGTKALMNWATQTISRELAPYHIRVNAVAPGVTDTDMNHAYEKGIAEHVMPAMNIQRRAEPMEIAEGVLFLASEQASFVSGQVLRIDGGRFNG